MHYHVRHEHGIGFDYRKDNMAGPEELVVLTRPFNFAIVDEVTAS